MARHILLLERHAGVSLDFSAVGEPDRRIQRVPPSHTLSRRKLEISFGLFQLPISEPLLAACFDAKQRRREDKTHTQSSREYES